MSGNGNDRQNGYGLEEILFPTDEPIAVKAARKVAAVFKQVMSFSGPTVAEVQGDEEAHDQPSGADVYFDDSNSDERLRGLSMENAVIRARSLMVKDSARKVANSVRTAMSLGEVEMSEILRSTSQMSGTEIEVDFSTPSSSDGAPGSSGASTSYDVV